MLLKRYSKNLKPIKLFIVISVQTSIQLSKIQLINTKIQDAQPAKLIW